MIVEIEIEGAEGAWCGIMEEGQTAISGYVQCAQLERVEVPKKRWKSIGPPSESSETPPAPITDDSRPTEIPEVRALTPLMHAAIDYNQ